MATKKPAKQEKPQGTKESVITAETAVVPAETKEVAAPAKSGTVLNVIGASPELKARIDEVRGNLESVENFQLPRVKMTPDGASLIEGQPAIKELIGVLIHTKKTNVYYSKPYNKNDLTAPDCFSLDGMTPDKSIAKPVSAACKGCPMAEFGTNSMKSGKACRNLKPLYILLADEAIMPRQLTVTPSSLKAANQYLMDLTERGLSYRKVRTKIEFFKKDPNDTFMTARFSLHNKLEAQPAADAEALRNFWLPVMNNQTIDQGEFDTTHTPVAAAKDNGEY